MANGKLKLVVLALTEHETMALLQSAEECYYQTFVQRTTAQQNSRRSAMRKLHKAMQGTSVMQVDVERRALIYMGGDMVDPPMDVSMLTPEAVEKAVSEGVAWLQGLQKEGA